MIAALISCVPIKLNALPVVKDLQVIQCNGSQNNQLFESHFVNFAAVVDGA